MADGAWNGFWRVVFGSTDPERNRRRPRPAPPLTVPPSEVSAPAPPPAAAAPEPAPAPAPEPPRAAAAPELAPEPAPEPPASAPDAAPATPESPLDSSPPAATAPAPEPAPPQDSADAAPPAEELDAEIPRETEGTRDVDAPSPDDVAPPVVEGPATTLEPVAAARWTDGWNPAVPEERRLRSPNRRPRPPGAMVDRVIIHVTGTADFAPARATFLRPRSTSAHYVIDRNGDLYQFVPENEVAYHAGIQSYVQALYDRNDGEWRKYRRKLGGMDSHYGSSPVYVDENLQETEDGSRHVLVRRRDGAPWDYSYFDQRFPGRNIPLGYDQTKMVNTRSIGIETVGYGGRTAAAYTDAMYATLRTLVADICARHNLPLEFGPVCGHEHVNPVERWGWDPGQGFDWQRVLGS